MHLSQALLLALPLLSLPLTAALTLDPDLYALNLAAAAYLFAPHPLTKRLTNLQTFTGTLGGGAPAIEQSGDSQRQFSVDGSTFPDFESAAQRSCDVQFDTCQRRANSGGRRDVQGQSDGQDRNRNDGGGGGGNGGKGNGRSDGDQGGRRDGYENGGEGRGGGRGGRRRREAEEASGFERRQNGGLTVQKCEEQKADCNAAQKNAPVKAFDFTNEGPDPNDPDFDLICEG